MAIRKAVSVFLAAALAAAGLTTGIPTVYADSRGNPDGVYLRQESSGKCTLASATMMLRQKSLNEGNPTWKNITQSSVRQHGWVEGIGIKHTFTYYGITVTRLDLSDGESRAAMISLLEEHPEGVEIYDRSIPHAVLLTRYDSDEDIFYCADPALSDMEMELASSWMRKTFSGAGQEDILANIDCVWVITSYSMQSIPSSESSQTDSSSEDGDNDPVSDGSTGDPDADCENNGGDALVTDEETDTSGSAVRNDDKETSSGRNIFPAVRDFENAGFSDVDMTEWYAPYVESVYETGLMSGLSGVKAGTFGIDGSMTLAQTITIASRVYSKYKDDNEQFAVQSGDSWIDPYVRYALKHGIITDQTADSGMLDSPVTRARFCEIINSAVDDSDCAQINTIKDGQFSDIRESDAAGKAVYRLSRAGIITGDSKGNFLPDSSISRAQAAAVIARVTDKSLRVKAS